LAFGDVAELYDRSRPSYPDALVDDVIDYAEGGGALEVGAGTGKATVMFARRGLSIHALEPSAEMAALARRNCAGYDAVKIEQCEFEQFGANGARFGLLYSAQAWHWINPEVRYVKARRLLVDGGALAMFWNRPRWENTPLRRDLRIAYERAAPDFGPKPGPMHPATDTTPDLWGDWPAELAASPEFGAPAMRLYERDCEYSTDQYLQLLQTHSDHIMLGPQKLPALLAAVGAVLERHGGRIPIRYVTVLCVARAA
jgi:SAM-dependent methyltransferase